MTTIIYYPTGDGDIEETYYKKYPTTPDDYFSRVDDPSGSPDDATSYIYKSGGGTAAKYALFTFSGISVPEGSTDIEVKVVFRHFTSGFSYVSVAEKVCGTRYYWDYTSSTLNNVWEDFTDTILYPAINPHTGLVWTAAEVNGSGVYPLEQIGVRAMTTYGVTQRFTQLYAIISYTEQVTGGVIGVGGTGGGTSFPKSFNWGAA